MKYPIINDTAHYLWINKKVILNPTVELRNNIVELGKKYANHEKISKYDVFVAYWSTIISLFVTELVILFILLASIVITNAFNNEYIWHYTSIVNTPFIIGVIGVIIGTIAIASTNKRAYKKLITSFESYFGTQQNTE